MPRRSAAKKIDDLPALEIVTVDQVIPISRIIELRNKKLTCEEIGAILGCSKQNIAQRLQPLVEELDGLTSFKDNRADVLAAYQAKLLNSLSTTEVQKASPYQKVGMFGLLYDKERLERGQSTSNVAYADYSRSIQDQDREIMALEQEVGIVSEDKEE